MPWVNKEGCTGCGICVEECPVGAISMQGKTAIIDMKNCIRCAICHEVCPEGEIRHDSEKIPEKIESNVKKVIGAMEACARYLGNDEERKKCFNRMIKSFNNDKKVIESTIKELKAFGASIH